MAKRKSKGHTQGVLAEGWLGGSREGGAGQRRWQGGVNRGLDGPESGRIRKEAAASGGRGLQEALRGMALAAAAAGRGCSRGTGIRLSRRE